MSKITDLIAKYCPNGVEYKTIKELFVALPKGTLKREQLIEDGKYPVRNSGREWYGYNNDFNNDCNAIIFAARGEYAGFVSFVQNKFWAGGLCYP